MNARILRQAAVGIATLGLLIPPSLLSAAETPVAGPPAAVPPSAMIADIALGADGTLRGQVVNTSGGAMPGVSVTVRQQETVIAETISNPAGKFEITGIPGGVFQITTDKSEGNFRFWAPETAPPGSHAAVLVVHDTTSVRGQSAFGRLFSRPLAVALVVATAVAVPIVVHKIEVDRKSGS